MSKYVDIIGKRYNKLVVEAITGKDKHGNYLYSCRCDCGNTVITTARSLNTGDRKSCGCARIKNIVGQTFGEWTVVSYAQNGKWNCRCKCGTIRIVAGSDLKYGKSKSCGCKHSNDLVGKIFGRLAVIEDLGTRTQGNRTEKIFVCLCECGNRVELPRSKLVTGSTRSCGCLHRDILSKMSTKHGFRRNGNISRLYHTWQNLKNRCENKNLPDYKFYGARGIAVCDEWIDNFQNFYDWAMANGYSDDLTIDRIDNDKGYSPDNCRWVTIQAQQRNKRTTIYITYNGETLPLIDMAEKYNISYDRLYQRVIKAGWDIERAITTSCEG